MPLLKVLIPRLAEESVIVGSGLLKLAMFAKY